MADSEESGRHYFEVGPDPLSDEENGEVWEDETDPETARSSRTSSASSQSTRSGSSDSDSCSGSEQEDIRDYKRGGYHPLKPRDFLNNRYLIIRKLGWGHFSTVWMAFDQTDNDFKALKVVRSASTYTETARDEIDLLLHAAKACPTDPHRDRIVRLHDHFELDGPFGHHVVLVMEITGPSLFSVCRRAGNHGLKLQTVRNLTRRILEGLAYMHEKAQMIHTDLKPENVSLDIGAPEKLQLAKEALWFSNHNLSMPKSMVSTFFYEKIRKENQIPTLPRIEPEQSSSSCDIDAVNDLLENQDKGDDAVNSPLSATSEKNLDPAKDICDPSIKIVDMGNACWTYKKFTSDIQTREYRAFEVLMGSDYQANVDVWSVGCMAFELATGDYLFNPRHGEDFATDEDHVAQMIERIGYPSRKVATKGKYCHKFFNRRGHFKCFSQKELDPQSISALLIEEYKWKPEEARIFAQFIEACLIYDPALRPSAFVLLSHPFFDAELSDDHIMREQAKNPPLEAGDTAASSKLCGPQELTDPETTPPKTVMTCREPSPHELDAISVESPPNPPSTSALKSQGDKALSRSNIDLLCSELDAIYDTNESLKPRRILSSQNCKGFV
ncbi:serine/threonine-protein kinase SRPK-like [Paramacrobiotus metropolitanus]|uniref:serine/threonine-protein kinase SRPK-like n=1 Tax=Paramacrobiotus metropolitanus TaxID=2943436 RepID=UPI0024462017|nr:serine/threonine-protein kinase SRPK-like [Paramacrobiotus metropolitanus]